MKQLLTFFSLLGLLCSLTAQQSAVDPQALPVWVAKADPDARMAVGNFRYAFQLEAMPEAATISLFANSRYHLRVNGHFVAFGPARSYPQHPEYDTHDLRPYLQTGKNVIAVQVLSNGTHSFQLRRHPATFWAWGQIQTGTDEAMDLRTPGDWRAQRSDAYDPKGPRMTFALPAMELYDARKEAQNWYLPEYDAGAWAAPATISAEVWGPLQPRGIPMLTNSLVAPFTLAGAWQQAATHQIWSFRRKTPDAIGPEYRLRTPLLAYTYIYSPAAQTVTAGVTWGEHSLNGSERLAGSSSSRPSQELLQLELNEGWNLFQVRFRTERGSWDYHLQLPAGQGLVLSPEQKQQDTAAFRVSQPSGSEALNEELEALPAAWNLRQWSRKLTWTDEAAQPVAVNPAFELAWTDFGEGLGYRPDQTESLTVPDNAALVYDFRYKRLGRVIVEYEAPTGTVFDLGYTEDTLGNKPRVLKRDGLFIASRHIAAGGRGRIETFRPYGLRYLQLNISNSGGQPVKVYRVRVMEHVYPQELQGSFACSDPMYNAIWAIGWRTLRVCMEDSYTDTPFRERGLYAGDMLPQMAITLVTSGDLRLVKQSLRLFQDMYADLFIPGYPRYVDEIATLEDYPLMTLEALSWYVDRSGDTAFVRELYPAYRHLIDTQLGKRNEAGRVFNDRVFIDWIQLDKTEVYSASYHALLARSCQLMVDLGNMLGETEAVAFYAQSRENLRKDLFANYWNPEVGAFRDGWQPDSPIDHYFPIASAWPYLFGLTEASHDEMIIAHLVEKLDSIGPVNRHRETNPYGSFYLLSALYKAGKVAEAETFIRKHWSPMVLEHDDTAWENFGDEGIGTLSHAWSGHPTYFLTTRALGIQVGWPDHSHPDRVRIAPQSAQVSWARGSVPHPRGEVYVHWYLEGGKLYLNYRVPEGVEVDIAPEGRLGELPLLVTELK